MAAAEVSFPGRKVQSREPNQVLTRWDDLSKAGCTRAAFFKKYEELYSTRPDCVYVNEGVCMDYGHYCYTIQGECSYNDQIQSTVMRSGDSKELVNNTDQPVTYHVQLKATQSKSLSVTVTKESEYSFGNTISVNAKELGIQGQFSTSDIILENSIGFTNCITDSVEVAESVDVTLKPGERAVAILDITWTELKQNFSVPFVIDGWCIAKFPKIVNGHYYWFYDISSFFDTPESNLHGKVDCMCNVKGTIHVTPLY